MARKKKCFFISLPAMARFAFLALLSAAITTRAAAEEPIGYAYQDRVADAATIIAVEKGFFRQQGLDLSPRRFSSSRQCTEALVEENAVFGSLGDAAAVTLGIRRPGGFVIVCAHGGGENRHRIIASAKSGIRQIADLAGKRIGVEKESSAHCGLLLFGRRHGLDLTPNLVDLAPSLQLTALAAGVIDALAASEPTPSQAEAGGYGTAVATLGGLDTAYPMVTMVNERFARRHPETVVRAIRALIRATLFIKARPREAAAILGRLNGLSANRLDRAMALHYYRVELSRQTSSGLRETARFLLEAGRIDKLPDLDRTLDGSYLKEAQDNRG